MINKYQEFFKEKFPNATLDYIGSGVRNYAFELNKKQILRVPKNLINNRFATEVAVLEYIQDALYNINIPKLSFYHEDNIPYTIHDKLCGNKWDYNQFAAFSKPEQQNFISSLVTFTCAMHEFTDDCVMGISAPLNYSYWPKISYDYMVNHFDCYLLPDEIERLHSDYCNFSTRHKTEDFSPLRVLLHGDLSCDNILLSSDKSVHAVYGFSNTKLGEIELEFVPLFCPETKGLLSKVLREYEMRTMIELDMERIAQLTIAECVPQLARQIFYIEHGSRDFTYVKELLHRIRYAQSFINNR